MPNDVLKLVPDKKEGFVPLTVALATFPPFWGIEYHYADATREALDSVDFASHVQAFTASMSSTDDAVNSEPYCVDENGIATIRAEGVLMRRPSSWGRNTSYVALRRAFRQAKNDDRVKAVALVFDTPGGNVDGVYECSNDLWDLRQAKTVGAYVEGMCCSCGYLLASQCNFIYLPREAMTANCGVIMTMCDTSAAAKLQGVRVVQVKSAPLKGIGASGMPLTDEQITEFQRLVDQFKQIFMDDVKRGRKLTPKQLDVLFDARIRIGADAVKVKAADKVATIDQFYARLGDPNGADHELGKESKEMDDDPPDDSQPEAVKEGALPIVEAAPFLAQTAELEPSGTKEIPIMRTQFASLLAAVGLTGLAGAVLGAPDDSEASIQAAMKTQAAKDASLATPPAALPTTAPAVPVESLAARTAGDRDILTVCQANGIGTSKDLLGLIDMAKIGAVYAEDLRENAKSEAVRAYGEVLGVQLQAQCDLLPIEAIKTMRDAWRAEADKKFGIGNTLNDKTAKDGEAAKRKSLPKAVAQNAETEIDTGEGESSYDGLSAEHKEIVDGMIVGGDKATLQARREAVAVQFLASKGGK